MWTWRNVGGRMNYEILMDRITADFRSVLGDKLTGIYVHGSIAFGCFRWETSDVDFLAVVKAPLTHEEKTGLIRRILNRVPESPEKGIEMSVVTEEACRNFVYPTPYELHFSNAHLARYEEDLDGYCETLKGSDPDLAGHFSVTKVKGIAWYGKPIEDVFGEVPREALLESIRTDARDAGEDGVFENPTYFVLNLCRVIACQEKNLLLSKQEGGEWGLRNLPKEYGKVIRGALNAYTGDGEMTEAGVAEFRNYALSRIFES